jgi:hypothetical protein
MNILFSLQKFVFDTFEQVCDTHVFLPSFCYDCVRQWKAILDRETGTFGKGGNKLQTYIMFKDMFVVEAYCKHVISVRRRGAIARFRTGTAPIRIETGRYEALQVSERKCFMCDHVEDEVHVLTQWPLYEDLRFELYNNAMYLCPDFYGFTDCEKLCLILSNADIVQFSAKTCWLILERRRRFLSRCM